MEPPLPIVLAALVGLLAGALAAALWAWFKLRAVRAEAHTARQSAAEHARALWQRAADERARESAQRAQEAGDDVTRGRGESAEIESALAERQALLSEREARAAGAQPLIAARERRLADLLQESERLAQAHRHEEAARFAALETAGGITRAAAMEQRVLEMRAGAELRAQKRQREAEQAWESEAAPASARVMAIVLDRYNGVGHLEHIQNAVEIQDAATLRALADTPGPTHAAFAEMTGCELVCDPALHTATVRGDDPLGREVARRVLRQIANRNTHDPDHVRKMAVHVKDEVEREVHNAGRKALRVLGVGRVHPEILHLVGRLKFRLSYSQNQWKHAVEVGYLAGLLAYELGVDVTLARRGGLLHDIGKALTHEREGAHAVLGAEVARRCGEDERVANAIGSHHFDEPPQGPLAYLVTAADALSGARPGARRENATHYLQRLRDIQAIAARSPAVERVDVMHAGREVRVVVAGRDQEAGKARSSAHVLADDELYPLAQQIARAIEAELTFAGQIRVTVIRESRAVSVAY